jgi:hypothetical protein
MTFTEFIANHCVGQYDSCTVNNPCRYASSSGCTHPRHPKNQPPVRIGRPKETYKYSNEYLLSLCKQDETQIDFECRTGIGIMTIVRRFGSFSKYKQRAATGTADLTSRPSTEPTRQQDTLAPPHNYLLSNEDV